MSQQEVNEHLAKLRDRLFHVKAQVLKPGDTYVHKGEEVEVESRGILPFKKNGNDAGFDLFTPERVVLAPGEVKTVPLNVRLQLPEGCWARVETKSGLGSKGQLVYAGVIDQDYRGVIHAVLANLNSPIKEWRTRVFDTRNEKFELEVPVRNEEDVMVWEPHTKIAQLTMNPHSLEYFIEEVGEDDIDFDTERGQGGFGSTGDR